MKGNGHMVEGGATSMQHVQEHRDLAALLAGNERFMAGEPQALPATARRAELANGQAPFAVVLGCSDSRVPVEAVFDQRPGDVFVVRVAGNFVDDNGLGSLEFAVEILQSSLLLVLGHSSCGAVTAAVKYLQDGTVAPGHIQCLVEAVIPAAKAAQDQPGDWVANAVVENVRHNVRAVTERSSIVSEAVNAGKLTVVGGVYDLRSGQVTIVTPG